MPSPHFHHRAVRQAIPATAGTQDYTIPNFGTPKGVIVLLSRCSADGTVQDHYGWSLGLHAVGGNTRTIAVSGQDNVANSNTARSASTEKIAILIKADTSGSDVVGNIDSTITDGIRINWTTVDGTGHLCTVILIGGSNTSVHVNEFDMPDNSGSPNQTQDITDAGFSPNYILFTGAAIAGATGSNLTVSSVASIGFFGDKGGTLTQACVTMSDGDNRATSAPSSASYTDRVFSFIRDASNTPLTTFHSISVDSLLSSGFRVKDLLGTDPPPVFYMAVSTPGGSATVAEVNSPTTGGGTATITPSFEPGSIVVLSTLSDAVGQKANDQAGQTGFGFASRFEEFSASSFQEDAAATMNTGCLTDDKVIALTNHVGAVSLEASATFSDTQVTLTFPTVLGTARKQFVMVLQEGELILDAPAALPLLELLPLTVVPVAQLKMTAPALTFLELDEFAPGLQVTVTAPAITNLELFPFPLPSVLTMEAPPLTFLELDDFALGPALRGTAPALTFLELDEFAPGNLRFDGTLGLQEAQLLPFPQPAVLRMPDAQGTLELALFAAIQPQLRLTTLPLTVLEFQQLTFPPGLEPVALTNKKRVYDALMANVKAATGFRETTYQTSPTCRIIEGAAVLPQSIELNETRSDYQIAERWRRSLKFQRDLWVWELTLRFDNEVITELFEKALLDQPLTLPRDDANGLEAVTIIMDDTRWEHPPRMSASNGTQVKYRFVAALGPV